MTAPALIKSGLSLPIHQTGTDWLIDCCKSKAWLEHCKLHVLPSGQCTVRHTAALQESLTDAILWSVSMSHNWTLPCLSWSATCLISKTAGNIWTVFWFSPNQKVALRFGCDRHGQLVTCFPGRHDHLGCTPTFTCLWATVRPHSRRAQI